MADNEHGRIIASQAKLVLKPAGFRRKGQSRIWIADRGFWLSVVEFQPSSWSKGTYLNVAVHWLWGSLPETTTFDRVERIGQFVPFESPPQFLLAVDQMAKKVVEIDQVHRSMFPSVQATAKILVSELQPGAYGEWAAFHAGVAAGLAGDFETARRLFESAQRHAASQAQALLAYIDDPAAFRSRVRGFIEAERAYYGLGALPAAFAI
ncbi:hypothetical protein X735_25240 [Mesorhizobium sp. L2C085B000]|uniref:DUF4304 domain-containing protein n=1 Tax=Mesorhizobium sp. L2C085B000 TaxID=1287117 RepID=UPI0003D02FF8|nr:DUF4304 domain-containing protein [Mesorhizobium sp. L2C085B000]ESZ11358.1 hypothetical protein X735_25240 [Mesorhizobium sp. L2C085B000]